MKKRLRGTITPMLLVITGALLVVLYSIIFVLSLQFDFSNRQLGFDTALNISEAGVNYYRWHLAHDPSDFTDGTGGAGPYEHEYYDPEGNAIGKYSLEITPPTQGSSIVTIRSTGWTYQFPKIKRSISVQYGIPSFAKYSFLSNASSWYGGGITINGLVHSNNGIRMDGTNTSLVTSAKQTYQCGSETGCHPPQNKPGIWGSGGDQGLWQFPSTAVDFDAISLDLPEIKTSAQNEGLYLDSSGREGYHIIFSSDGSYTVKRVNNTDYVRGYSVPGEGVGAEGQGGCRRLYQKITSESVVGTYNISDKPIIFVEDNVWIEGDIRGRVTVVAAKFPIQANNVDIWINGNLSYTAYDGTDVLGIISQDNIFFVRDVPNDFKIDAVLMAQKGKIIRHMYTNNSCSAVVGSVKNTIEINGALINYYKSYWNYTSGGTLLSGFRSRTINYDSHLLYAPPPYFPTTGEYEFISWLEEKP